MAGGPAVRRGRGLEGGDGGRGGGGGAPERALRQRAAAQWEVYKRPVHQEDLPPG